MKRKVFTAAVFSVLIIFIKPVKSEVPGPEAGSEPILVESTFVRESIGRRADIMIDESSSIAFEQVLSEQAPPFEKSISDAPGYGYTKKAVWFRFAIDYRGTPGRELFVEVDNPLLDRAELYEVRSGGFTLSSLGDRVPFSERSVDYRNPVFRLQPSSGENHYYMRFSSGSNMNLNIVLWDPDRFAEAIAKELPIQWLFVGLLLALIIYNFFLYLSIRDVSYLYYVLFVGGFLIFRMSYIGLSYQYLWPGSIWWANVCVPFFVAILTLFAIMFTKSFLDTSADQPVIDKIFTVFAVLFTMYLPMALILDYSISIRITLASAIPALVCFVLAGIRSALMRRREGYFYLLSWAVFLLGSFMNIFRDFGVFETGMFVLWTQQAGTGLQALLLSFALADRINSMKKQIIAANDTIVDTYSKLDRERELLAVTMRSIVDAVITTDLADCVTMMNATASRLFADKGNSYIGENISALIKTYDGSSLADPDSSMSGGMSVKILTVRGEPLEMQITRSPLRDSNSRIIGYVNVFRDVTDQRLIEREARRSNRLDALSSLAGGIAHDFNNILTAISANISLARLSDDDRNELALIFYDMEHAMEGAKHLTSQLTSFSKGGTPVKREYRLQEIIRDTVKFTLSGANVTVDYHIDCGLWSAEVDPGQLGQVINNLVLNAVQAMPSGGTVTVSARNLQIDEGSLSPFPAGCYVVISIKDSGPGMEPGLIDRIFDPFFTTKQNGTGLGLFSVHNIIKNHGGAIDITSEQGSGTLFTIYLPATGRFTEAEGEGTAPAEGSGVSTAEPVLSRGRILLMDDEELVSRAAKRLLSRMGYEVDITDCSSGAVEVFRRCLSSGGKYDAVILDLTIPGGPGGVDTLRLLKEIDPGVRCIVSSGYSVDPVMISWRENGFDGAVVKPYSLDDLAAVLKEAAGKF